MLSLEPEHPLQFADNSRFLLPPGLDIRDVKERAWDATCYSIAEEYTSYRCWSQEEDIPLGDPFQERVEEVSESLGHGRALEERFDMFLPRAVEMVKEMYADIPRLGGRPQGEAAKIAYDLHRPEISSVVEEVLYAAEYDDYYEPPFARHGEIPTHRAQQVLLPERLEERGRGESILVASVHF